MSRLITFGCSNTFGEGLHNTNDAWPVQLSNLLDIECINLGRSGSSNRELWWNIINYDYRTTDTIVVLWTFPTRDCIIKGPIESPEQLGEWHKNKTVSRFMVETYNDYDRIIESHTYIQHANTLIHNIYNFVCDEVALIPYPKWQTIPLIGNLQPIYENGDRGNDNIHPGPKCHKQFANYMLDKIQKVKNETIPKVYPKGIHRVSVNHYIKDEIFESY